jgi:hypothetical protein
MDIEVVLGEPKPCPDLARRLAMVYNLLLHRVEEAKTGEKEAPSGQGLAATPAGASGKPDFNNRIAVPHGLA